MSAISANSPTTLCLKKASPFLFLWCLCQISSDSATATLSESAVAMSNIPGENITGMTRAEINSVIMNYLITGASYLSVSLLKHLLSGLDDLNQCDLNHWFQSQFKSIDLFVKKIEWFKSHWRFHLPMENYNKQDEIYCFILPIIQLIQLIDNWF